MRIDSHVTNMDLEKEHKELETLLLLSLNQTTAIRKRLFWNSVIGLLNLSVLCGIVVLRLYGYL